MPPVYDESTSHLLQPALSDEYLDDLDRLCDRLSRAPNEQESIIEAKIDAIEADLPDRIPTHDQDEMDAYTEQAGSGESPYGA